MTTPPPNPPPGATPHGTGVDARPGAVVLDSSGSDRLPLLALIVANLAPLGGVFFFDWDTRDLLLLYWLENLVVGAYTLIRMLHVGRFRALFKAAFFTFHYSFFCAGHGIFIMFMTAFAAQGGTEIPTEALGGDGFILLMPFNMLSYQIEWIAAHAPALLGLPLLAFVVSHGISTVTHHFIGREDANRTADQIMSDPYKRIVALHLAIIAGGFVVLMVGRGSPAPELLVLIAVKTGIDVHQHRRAHRLRRAQNSKEADALQGQDQTAA